MKKHGFTLIELLVVIVIIGILATISVATFSGYFEKARDTERKTVVRNAATIMKTALAVGNATSFNITEDAVEVLLLSEGGYAIPTPTDVIYEYVYVTVTTAAAQPKEFAIFACGEESANSIFVDGTAETVAAVRAAASTFCPGPPTAISIELDTVDAAGTIGLLVTNRFDT